VELALAGHLERYVFNEAVRDDIIARVRAELERQLAAPDDHGEGLETELRRLEAEKARLIRLAASTDDDVDIAAEVNDRRQRIAKLQAQLAGARHAPRVLKDALDRATAHVRARFADLRALLADRGEGGPAAVPGPVPGRPALHPHGGPGPACVAH
jgi:hypothetical protein